MALPCFADVDAVYEIPDAASFSIASAIPPSIESNARIMTIGTVLAQLSGPASHATPKLEGRP